MVFYICFGDKNDETRNVLFDIEFYQNQNHRDSELWNTEIRVSAIPSGFVDFCNRTIWDNKTWEDFKNDCNELTNLRGWLYESNNNSYINFKDALEREKIFYTFVRKTIYDFAKKFNLYVVED